MMDTFHLVIPDEHDFIVEQPLSVNDLRSLELISIFTSGIADAWADERVIEAAARKQGWRRCNSTLRSLWQRDLVEAFFASPATARPHSRHVRKPAMVWRLTHEGRLEHFAQRGRAFA